MAVGLPVHVGQEGQWGNPTPGEEFRTPLPLWPPCPSEVQHHLMCTACTAACTAPYCCLYCLQLTTDRYITLAIAKKGEQDGHWPRLLKTPGKTAPNIKVAWDVCG